MGSPGLRLVSGWFIMPGFLLASLLSPSDRALIVWSSFRP